MGIKFSKIRCLSIRLNDLDLIYPLKMTLSNYMMTACICIALQSCGQKKESKMHTHTNSLIEETSPYLLQHAHNPVDWHAWNDENLAEAKKLGKPLLISIGYSSCHWCHVMEHESFENEVIAEYMNTHFYCIKVDREERPDVDQIYMTAANIISGSGGWPLNCFALPNGKPFHAGTYYPPAGWQKLLESVNEQYASNREKLEEYAEKLTTGIRMQETAITDIAAQKLDSKVLVKTVEGWKASWDMKEGGMNRAPKFPMPSNYKFLMDYTYHFSDKYTDNFIQTTLTKMAYGGIFDQIGGGFSRYSVDALWKAPHFEKMGYDNGQLLSIYAKAFNKYGDSLYLEVIQKTVEWLSREMQDKSKMFYSALDADSEGEEGKFYVWRAAEAQAILGDDYPLAEEYYQIGSKGKWEHGNNILLRDDDPKKIAKKFSMTTDDLAQNIDRINSKLLKARSKRIRPGLDDKCLTAWNALLITGLCDAYSATANEDYKNMALECLDATLAAQATDAEVWHSYKNGKSTIKGLLDDYAFLGQACVGAYQISGNENYITKAQQLTQVAIDKFYDVEKEIFYFNEENELIVRTTEIHDNVIPATNSAMANLLLEVGLIYGKTDYLSLSENLVGKVQQNMANYPGGHSNWALAHIKQSMPYYEIAVVGKDAEEIATKLRGHNLSNTLIAFSEKSSDVPLMANRFAKGKTLIYVCQKGICQLPVASVNEALELIK